MKRLLLFTLLVLFIGCSGVDKNQEIAGKYTVVSMAFSTSGIQDRKDTYLQETWFEINLENKFIRVFMFSEAFTFTDLKFVERDNPEIYKMIAKDVKGEGWIPFVLEHLGRQVYVLTKLDKSGSYLKWESVKQ